MIKSLKQKHNDDDRLRPAYEKEGAGRPVGHRPMRRKGRGVPWATGL